MTEFAQAILSLFPSIMHQKPSPFHQSDEINLTDIIALSYCGGQNGVLIFVQCTVFPYEDLIK